MTIHKKVQTYKEVATAWFKQQFDREPENDKDFLIVSYYAVGYYDAAEKYNEEMHYNRERDNEKL